MNKEALIAPEATIASEKLQVILSRDMLTYGGRFMNEGEYRAMCASQKIIGQKCVTHLDVSEHEGPRMNLIERMRESRKEILAGPYSQYAFDDLWRKRIYNFTGRMQSCERDIQRAADIMRILYAAVFKHVPKKDSLREEVLKHIQPAMEEELSGLWNYDVLPKNFTKLTRVELRKLFNTITRHPSTKASISHPYHVWAVFSHEAVNTKNKDFGFDHLCHLHSETSPHHVIGAFSLLPQKDLAKDMINWSSTAGPMAHPIFDMKGNLCWPK